MRKLPIASIAVAMTILLLLSGITPVGVYASGESWQATATIGAPEGRALHSAVWTGNEVNDRTRYTRRLCSGATDPSASEQYGRFTAARLAIVPAAITSAEPANPQDVQTNVACVLRFSFAQCPQTGQVREVLRGSTKYTGTPRNCAL
jgi:hypothetical protein